jgi:pSer/pThr/pTyr-binding forkhead associated (FHA) protein
MNAKLLVVQGRPQGKSLLFPPGEYVFGRGTECHIRPNSDWVSRQHCLLRVAPGPRLFVRDLGSRNGTLVNGIRITAETSLKHGDHLQVGPLVFEVLLEESSITRKSAVNTPHHTDTLSLDTTPLPGLEEVNGPSTSDAPPAAPQNTTQSDFALSPGADT